MQDASQSGAAANRVGTGSANPYDTREKAPYNYSSFFPAKSPGIAAEYG
jgi:hypothetical protein